MERLLANPLGLAILLCFGGVVVLSTVGLGLLLARGPGDLSRLRRAFLGEAEGWQRTFAAGASAQERQAAEMDELRRRVAALAAKPADPAPPAEDETAA